MTQTPMLEPSDQDRLLALARASVTHAIDADCMQEVAITGFPLALRQEAASFVTLNGAGQLRGCIGHLEANQALCLDVNENAFAAATRDGRFEPIRRGELDTLQIEISVLTTPTLLDVNTETALLSALRPGIDGLILELGRQRATFLPAVWKHLPDQKHFVRELKLKAGLPADHWSEHMVCRIYQTSSFSDQGKNPG